VESNIEKCREECALEVKRDDPLKPSLPFFQSRKRKKKGMAEKVSADLSMGEREWNLWRERDNRRPIEHAESFGKFIRPSFSLRFKNQKRPCHR
jgi:hypothetical protein